MREAVTTVVALAGRVGCLRGGSIDSSAAGNRGGGVLGGKYHGWVGQVLVCRGISCADVVLLVVPVENTWILEELLA